MPDTIPPHLARSAAPDSRHRDDPEALPAQAGGGEPGLIVPLQPQPGHEATQGSEALAALQEISFDAERGFETMVDRAEPEFRSVSDNFRDLHARHAATVGQMLAARGVEPASGGSYMGNVNKAVVMVRAFFDKIDADVMDQVRDGERHVLDAFDAALAAPLFPREADTLRGLRSELTDLLQRTRALG